MSTDWHEPWCRQGIFGTNKHKECTCSEIPQDVMERERKAKNKMKKENPEMYDRLYRGT